MQHSWDLDTAGARELQLRLASLVDHTHPLGSYETAAGADVSYNIRAPRLYAAIVVVRAGTWSESIARESSQMPSFRMCRDS